MECRTCRWWDRDEIATDYGVCRRRAPTSLHPAELHRQESRPEAVWPGVIGDNWCGDYQIMKRKGK